jgi:hypothetical protein
MTGRLPSSVGPARGAFTTARPCSPLVQEQWSIVNPGDKMDSGNGRVI